MAKREGLSNLMGCLTCAHGAATVSLTPDRGDAVYMTMYWWSELQKELDIEVSYEKDEAAAKTCAGAA